MMRSTCFLCSEPLEAVEAGIQKHPASETCLVEYTDGFGVALDEQVIANFTHDGKPPDETEEHPSPNEFFSELDIRTFPYVEEVLLKIFAKYGIQRLGGVSTGRGWSAFNTFQRCRYLYKRRYLTPVETIDARVDEPEARAVGTIIHSLLAVYYTRMIEESYPLTPQLLRDEMLSGNANPDFVNEGYRVFNAYGLYYQSEEIMPLAVEYDLKDPRTGESCRYDLIAFFPKNQNDRLAGTYNVEHKSSSRFDDIALNGWANDGEILGQTMLWDRLKLGLRFGPLRGTIVNILGKQKDPKFHRTTVPPETWQKAQHARDLKFWEAEIQHAKAVNYFPRSRAACIDRFGKCDLYDHCSGESDEAL